MSARNGALGWGWWLGVVAVVLLGLMIWFGGPYLGIGESRPLVSVIARLIGLLLVVIVWALLMQIKLLRAARSGEKLARAVAGQEDAAPVASSSGESPDVRVLRERFQRAVSQLRQSSRSKSLYQLPWYMIIGPPGSGKTTALLNAGLRFPLESELGRKPIGGVGGTRNCDWWITEEAILLDTAGRYTTQDSNEIADRAGWREFLALLRRYRGRRPINGVLVTVSAADLLLGSAEERERHALAVRHRLQELRAELKVAMPVYVLVTKLDLVAGFNEFFVELNRNERAQVWGVTFPVEHSRDGSALRASRAEFDLLVQRLQDRVITRLAVERDVGRRALIHAFPAQVAALEKPLADFLGEIVRGTSLATDLWFRGCYFTSGTQAGTPIDRMVSAMASQFGLGMNVVLEPGRSGKSYFLESLLKLVIFPESGLAGVNRRLELQRTALGIGAYAAIGGVVLLGLSALVLSYRNNRQYLTELDQFAEQVLPDRAAPDVRRMESWVGRLDALRDVQYAAQRHADVGVPWRMRWGLYQGQASGDAASDAYHRQLNASLGPWVGQQLATRLRALGSSPETLYEYLRAYLMLTEGRRIVPEELEPLATAEIHRSLAADGTLAERVATHFSAWIGDAGRFQSVPRDETLVEQARISLRTASLPRLMYGRLRAGYVAVEQGQVRLDRELSVGGEELFVRRSGKSLGEPLSALYTREVFDEYNRTGRLKLLQQFLDDRWVLGDHAPSIGDAPQLASEVLRLYETDYINTWDNLLADLALRSARDSDDVLRMLGVLGSSSSPLKRLLLLVDQQTNLLKPDPNANALERATDQRIAAATAGAGQLISVPAANQARPGSVITIHFQPFHRQVEGASGTAPIDRTLADVDQIQKDMQAAARGGGSGAAAAAAAALDRLGVIAAQLPGPVQNLVTQAGESGAAVAMGEVRTELDNRYASEVVRQCQELAAGRYPLARGSGNEVAPADFGRLFGSGGTYDVFYQTQLRALVDNSRSTWRYKEEARTAAAVPLAPFQRADRIRQTLFMPGSATPQLQITLTPEYLDEQVNRFRLTIDGQVIEYSHGPRKPVTISWPGVEQSGANLLFEENAGGRPNRSYPGAWGLFRLFDAAEVQTLSDRDFVLTIREGRSTARLRLTAHSARNPFADRSLLRFSCDSWR